MDLRGKKVLIVGMGKSGIATVNTLSEQGAIVYTYDKKTKEELKDILLKIDENKIGKIYDEFPDSKEFDLIVLSPGVPTDLDFIKEAKSGNVEVIGELELAYRLCKGTFIGITGTNGKTTTTALTGEIFKNAKKDTYVVGNIGVAAISKAPLAKGTSMMVTEVSSFQLESIKDFNPHIGAILNITPDHLNRHKTMENYINAKAHIFENQDENDYVILNKDNEETYKLASKCKSNVIFFSRKEILQEGVYVHDEHIMAKKDNMEYEICNISDLQIPGTHNLENALAATAICLWAGIDVQYIEQTLKEFMGVEHRTEFVSEINGVRYINDSKGTNPDASIKAIEAMKNPILLIAGGMDKGSDFTEFISSFKGKVKNMILLGETAEKIEETAKENEFYNITRVKDMKEAVKTASTMAVSGDCVLLSPACASWDMYKSYEVRGKDFKECVLNLRR
ncbi:MAG: UDP-N-acetylmuramoyl-L-alanine--D-glutamate ligase [Anaeromicrobium sp.]|jgi:UDP-N-acetylmuramoylalanine--D-glutamate ligase|uniref:UDP-N-acetylmuramoyl-L-alanine--D-glutamate ligase n=1 Tax=Anaeromicrobium sp. TaxID=1929132 RepID=UPI0025DD2FB7|nr:UDP-N-acetylmuramoyl-L-alanine--D-glutamate ligase [Anaeromicrobium sp.]MCT4594384.1 UDP-N-acetylmuramoyl-L-alanine--D-glutamate ligase [Anaeromicrobium sp.]